MERDFKGVWIPKDVWLNQNLTALDKIILVEIDSLDSEEYGACIASNEYLAEFCQCSTSKVANSISKLKKYGFIEQVSFDGRIRKLKSRLIERVMQTSKICKADHEKIDSNNIINKEDTNKNNNIIVTTPTENVEMNLIWNQNKQCECETANGSRCERKASYLIQGKYYCNQHSRMFVSNTKRFIKPTVEEVRQYCLERGNNINAEQFIDYYESKGWLVGKSPMKDWKACVRTWERNGYGNTSQTKTDRQKVAHDTGYMKGVQRDANGDIIF